MGNKISTYTAITTLANGDLLDISKDMGASTYATRKITYANLLTELNTDLTFPVSSNLGNANLTADNAARTFTLAGTSTEYLAFLNGSAAEILKLKGDRTILFGGYTTNGFVKTSAGTGLITVSTQVAATEGGTGISSYTTGDILYSSASNTLAKLAAGTNGHVLTLAAGVPSWAAAPNLGSANLTSSDDSRTFTLKSGGTASQNLKFLNSGGGNLLQLKGNNTIDFGVNGTGMTKNHYGEFQGEKYFYFGGTEFMTFDYSLGYLRMIAPNGTNTMAMRAADTKFEMNCIGDNSYINIQNSSLSKCTTTARSVGLQTVYLGNSGATLIDIFAYTQGYLAVNGAATAAANLEVFGNVLVKGSGSTSATTTALFQNSASVAALTIKDDLTSTFGGDVVFSQSTNSTATGGTQELPRTQRQLLF